MVDVNTIMGKPVSTHDGSVVLTVSKVAFGFGAGGSDFGDGVKKTRTAAGEKNLQLMFSSRLAAEAGLAYQCRQLRFF
ncbi:hypothetical protein GCM10020331_069400 [Ectobacillus funiculus]